MPKGKGKRDYEKEIDDAAKRMQKHPEHLKEARNSDSWKEFLLDVVGINPATIESEKGIAFWDDVRSKTIEKETGYTIRQLEEANVEVVTRLYRDIKGRFTKQVTGKPVYSYRSKETGRFVSLKSIGGKS